MEDVFKKRQPCHNKKELLSLHINRDPRAPKKLPEAAEKAFFAADEELKDLLEAREKLKRSYKPEKDEMRRDIYKKIINRRGLICTREFKYMRNEFFCTRSKNILRASGEQLLIDDTVEPGWDPDRQAVINALYPFTNETVTRLEALECLVQYCRFSQRPEAACKVSKRPVVAPVVVPTIPPLPRIPPRTPIVDPLPAHSVHPAVTPAISSLPRILPPITETSHVLVMLKVDEIEDAPPLISLKRPFEGGNINTPLKKSKINESDTRTSKTSVPQRLGTSNNCPLNPSNNQSLKATNGDSRSSYTS